MDKVLISTAAQIDNAVAESHNHANKVLLDTLDQTALDAKADLSYVNSLIPTAPSVGAFKLQSINGVLTWVAD